VNINDGGKEGLHGGLMFWGVMMQKEVLVPVSARCRVIVVVKFPNQKNMVRHSHFLPCSILYAPSITMGVQLN
jgi:hypothetical protein